MKHFYSLFLIVLTSVGYSQSFNQFDIDDSRWFVAESYVNANMENPSFVETETTVYGLNGDSLIDGNMWQRIISATDADLVDNPMVQGYVRSVDNVVLYRNEENVIDTLYNFDLSVGDSANFDFGNMSLDLAVESVDSVVINGEYVKRINFLEPITIGFFSFNEHWIEGVGSIHGPLFPANARIFSEEIPDSLMLTCSKSNGDLYWDNPFYDACVVNIILSLETPFPANIGFYPNPVSDFLTIEMEDAETLDVVVYSVHGQTMYSQKLTVVKTKIDMQRWASGMYFIHLTNSEKTIVQRIVKH